MVRAAAAFVAWRDGYEQGQGRFSDLSFLTGSLSVDRRSRRLRSITYGADRLYLADTSSETSFAIASAALMSSFSASPFGPVSHSAWSWAYSFQMSFLPFRSSHVAALIPLGERSAANFFRDFSSCARWARRAGGGACFASHAANALSSRWRPCAFHHGSIRPRASSVRLASSPPSGDTVAAAKRRGAGSAAMRSLAEPLPTTGSDCQLNARNAPAITTAATPTIQMAA